MLIKTIPEKAQRARRLPRALVAVATALLVACSASDPGTTQRIDQPEHERLAERHMISAAHPAAVEAGLDVLRAGGHAVDAAIAVQMILSFIEAPETGLGGGGFLLLHDAASGTTRMYDGRETAPAAADASRFRLLGRDQPLALAVPSGSAVGVPGLVAMLGQAHADHGRRPWSELLEPAAHLAEGGLPMPPRLQHQIESDWSLRLFADTRRFFRAQLGGPQPSLRNPALAQTLRQLAAEGAGAFYHGPIAEGIVDRVKDARWGKSDLSLEDLAAYQSRLRDAVCAPYREWILCGAAPPSSGGITLLQMLGMLEHFPLAQMAPDDPATLHLIAEVSRLAFADRNHYIGDPDQVEIPIEGLLDRDYLAQRASLVDPRRAMSAARPGEPGVRPEITELNPRTEPRGQGTSHFSVVDGAGNLVALTSSNEAPFGSRMLAGGMVLNNQLTDFTFDPQLGQGQHPNAVAPGKRPRSSMSPLIVLDAAGEPVMVIGSRGGSRIIGYVLKTVIGVLDWQLDIQDAIALPNIVERGQGIELEDNTPLAALADDLRELGHRVQVVPMTSGLHGIERHSGLWRGGADPRLDGVARGD
jgi:gamma-glutamyltranspeptidase / glutathione hydrolase